MDLNVQHGRTGGDILARRAYANDRRSLRWGLSGLSRRAQSDRSMAPAALIYDLFPRDCSGDKSAVVLVR
jgi:hypothetical protein